MFHSHYLISSVGVQIIRLTSYKQSHDVTFSIEIQLMKEKIAKRSGEGGNEEKMFQLMLHSQRPYILTMAFRQKQLFE